VTDKNEDPAPTVIPDNTTHPANALQQFSPINATLGSQVGRLTYARMPPKAPAREAALKKRDTRYCRSRRLYLVIVSQHGQHKQ
jgi:hypothetical protein